MLYRSDGSSGLSRFTLLFIVMLCVVMSVMPGKANATYQYQRDVEIYPSITWLLLTDMYAPQTMKFEWDAQANAVGGTLVHDVQCQIERAGGGFTSSTLNPATGTHHFTAYDDTGFSNGTTYQYVVSVIAGGDPDLGLPTNIPPGTPSSVIYDRHYWDAMTAQIPVTPMKVIATDNQAVDSRYDLRRADNHYLDFQFGDLTYKGGLFAGYVNDNARVGRSFLKFDLGMPLATDTNLWAGTVNAYYTGSRTNGTTTVGCQEVTTNWDQSNVVWTNAPSLTPSQATNGIALTYDNNNPTPRWCSWSMEQDIVDAMRGYFIPENPHFPLAVGLASTNETTAGWAYFAKKEYDNGQKAPCVLYATDEPFFVTNLSISPTSVKGGNSATGTVTINWPAPSGGFEVPLSYTLSQLVNPSPVSIPASVTVPQGSKTATFTINTTFPGMFPVVATIKAGTAMYFKTANLTVTMF